MLEENDDLNIPLCVDLDGTLLKTDLLYESVLYLVKKKFILILLIPFWVLKGRYFLKFKLLEYVSPTISSMPYNKDVIGFVASEKSKGRKIILVTATAQPLAEKVARFLGIFDETIASKDGINLVGKNKADRLINEFGEMGFDYIGDSAKDIYVWQHARKALIVGNNERLIKETRKVCEVSKIFPENLNRFKIFIKQIRVHQWLKNLLIFLPPLLAHKTDFSDYISAFSGFFAFSLVASAIYVINDLADIESDRNHTSKFKRPLASGKIKIVTCLKLIPILLLGGFLLSYITLNSNFTLLLLLYTIITISYSFKLKKMYLLDMITLSILYTIRLISGGILTDTLISPWLFSFSIFIFLSLGAMKRYTELKGLSESTNIKTRGRDYYVEDISLIGIIGISSGMISTLVFTLYIVNPEVLNLYNNPSYLYFIMPIVLYWILRMWFLSHRGMMNDDPIVFAIKDKTSYVVALLVFLLALGATI